MNEHHDADVDAKSKAKVVEAIKKFAEDQEMLHRPTTLRLAMCDSMGVPGFLFVVTTNRDYARILDGLSDFYMAKEAKAIADARNRLIPPKHEEVANWKSTAGDIAWCEVRGRFFLRFHASTLSSIGFSEGQDFDITSEDGYSWFVNSTEAKNLSIMED